MHSDAGTLVAAGRPARWRVLLRARVLDSIAAVILGLAVVGPWTGRGWLLLLDWTTGPNATLPGSTYGLDAEQIDAMPARIALASLRHLVGPQIASWLPILIALAVAAVGAARLVGGPLARRWPAGLIFVVNPFVFERLRAGHVMVLLGYAVLPWMVRSFLAARRSGRLVRVRAVAWLAVGVSVAPYMFWIGGVALLATLVRPRPTRRDVARVGIVLGGAAAVSAYALAFRLAGVRNPVVTGADLTAFAPAGAERGMVSVLIELLSLHGFWRGGTSLPRDVLGGWWPLLLVGILGVAVLGIRTAWRRTDTTDLAATVAVAGGAGLLLAAGIAGPLAPLYRLAVAHLPLFAVMRESEKFLMLLVMAVAVGVGFGVDSLTRMLPSTPGRAAVTIAAMTAIVALTPNLFWGLGGQVALSRYPDSWAQAEQLMGTGPESVLVLPWHAYQAYDFTDGRTVHTPAAAWFSRPVVTAESLELPGVDLPGASTRSSYLDQLMARGSQMRRAGRLLAPLDIAWVLVTRTTTDEQLDWVGRQEDLTLVLSTPDLALYRNTATGVGRVVGSTTVASIDDLVERANNGLLGPEAVFLDPAAEPASGLPTTVQGDPAADLVRVSPVEYRLDEGPAGWVVVPVDASAGWRLDGRRGSTSVSGALAIEAGSGAGTIGYRPWRIVLAGYLVSFSALLALVGIGLVEHHRDLAVARRRLLGTDPSRGSDR